MMRQLALALTVLLLLAACQVGDDPGGGAAAAESSAAAARDGVTVTGQGRVSGEPDTLRAIVGVHVSRPELTEAFDDATAASEQVLDAIREQGVDEEDIQTRDFSVHPDHKHPPPPPPDGPPGPPAGPPELSGYVVRNVVEVTVRDVDQAGDLLAAVTDAGGDDVRVQGIHFSLEDDEERLATAREAAFDDARAKAEHYAELTGADLGELVSVTELGGPHPPPVPGPVPPGIAEPPIPPGEQEVSVQLRATWALQ